MGNLEAGYACICLCSYDFECMVPSWARKYYHRGRVKWDQDKLGEIEANRHVRKEITEPKTPYPRTGEDGSLSPSLDPSNYYHTSEDQADATGKNEGYVEKMDEKEFKKKRSAHYDEIKRIKELKEKGWNIVQDEAIDEWSPAQDPDVREICINDCDDEIVRREICINDCDDEIVRTIDIEEMEDNLPKSKVD